MASKEIITIISWIFIAFSTSIATTVWIVNSHEHTVHDKSVNISAFEENIRGSKEWKENILEAIRDIRTEIREVKRRITMNEMYYKRSGILEDYYLDVGPKLQYEFSPPELRMDKAEKMIPELNLNKNGGSYPTLR